MTLLPPDALKVVSTPVEVAELARELRAARLLALDLESDGLFAYRAKVCVLQLACAGKVAIVDALSAPLQPLAELLGEDGPVKIVHDVGFDARLLAEAGVELGNVHDTALAARMLGRAATGLAGVLASELGLVVDKTLQHHDWRIRPLERAKLEYLAGDVVHLERLEQALFGRATELGIVEEIQEETRYRIRAAIAAAREPSARPGYLRLKGIERTSATERAILRRIVAARDLEAERLDVPPHRVASADALIGVARARPATVGQLRRVRGAPRGLPWTDAFCQGLLRGVAEGITVGDVPPEERAVLERPRVAPSVAQARRLREASLQRWRKGEAARRGVDEQVVLPGHCLKEIAQLDVVDRATLAAVGGLGAFRMARDGDAILRALAQSAPGSAPLALGEGR